MSVDAVKTDQEPKIQCMPIKKKISTSFRNEPIVFYIITATCSCGYSMTYTLRSEMQNQQKNMGPCPKCGSNEMSCICELRDKQEQAA